MAKCFKQTIIEDDSIILFSNSDSNEDSGCSSSTSSSSHHSPPPLAASANDPATTYKLNVNNLSYTLHQKSGPFPTFGPKQSTEILKSISFTAQSCEMLAIVGPSGTGKTTLLRIISGRVKDGKISPNSISLNDQPISCPTQLRTFCGYVAQEDDLLPMLTVKETFMFSAKFRLRQISSKERENKVEDLLHDLGLVQVANSYVGDEEKRGISGGERKRVSIGVELIHDPPILLLDEPTSGLDSSSALHLIELLTSMMSKSKEKMIVFSIHQPSYRMMEHISRFLILSHGSVVHNGSLKLLEQRISQLGYDIPMQINALEFAMEIITKLEQEKSLVSPNKRVSCCIVWKNGDKSSKTRSTCKDEIKDYFTNWSFEIITLCSRFWKVIYRTKELFLARTMQALVAGFGLGSVYVRMKKDEGGVGERLGLFAFSLSFLLSSTVEALPIYLQERKVIMKEFSRGAYKISSYMIANTIIFLPFLLLISLLFSIPVYWIVGLNPSVQAFIFFTFVVWLIIAMASSLVLFLSAISSDFIAGNSLICAVLGAFFLFSGYFIPKEMIPKYWIFMYYVSLYRYPLDTLIVNEYWDMRDDCFSKANGDPTKCLMNGYDVLKNRGLDKDTRWINVGIMIGFFFLYRIVCWGVLARRAAKTTL